MSLACNFLCSFCLVIDDDEDSDDEGHTVHQKACTVVWEGKVLDRAFSDWKVQHSTQHCSYCM